MMGVETMSVFGIPIAGLRSSDWFLVRKSRYGMDPVELGLRASRARA